MIEVLLSKPVKVFLLVLLTLIVAIQHVGLTQSECTPPVPG